MALTPESSYSPQDDEVPGNDLEPIEDSVANASAEDFFDEMFDTTPASSAGGEAEEDTPGEDAEADTEESVEEAEPVAEEAVETPESPEADAAAGEPDDSATTQVAQGLEDSLEHDFQQFAKDGKDEVPTEKPEAAAAPESEAAPVPEDEAEAVVNSREFEITTEDVDNLQRDPQKYFALFAQNVAQEAIDRVMDHLSTRSEPRVDIEGEINTAIDSRERNIRYINNLANLYQTRYPQHSRVMQLVGRITNEVSGENYSVAPHKLLKEVAERVDILLAGANGAPNSAGPPAGSVRSRPGSGSASSSHIGGDIESEIAEMFSEDIR